MKTRRLARLGLVLAAALTLAFAGCATPDTKSAATHQAASVSELLAKMTAANAATQTMSADFTYSVNSARRSQLVVGKARLMKPNFARLAFTYIAEPAFPNLIAADGRQVFTFTPAGFRPGVRINDVTVIDFADDQRTPTLLPGTFVPAQTANRTGFDPLAAAQSASGTIHEGGAITTKPAPPDGAGIALWDSIAIEAFFAPVRALNRLYLRSPDDLNLEAPQTIDDITYSVLHHRFASGNIAGGEESPFEQRLYISPEGLIHLYVLEFVSGGSRGTQVMRLTNVRLNEPMTPASFAFTPPTKAVAQSH